MRIMIEVEFTDAEVKTMCENNLERTINDSINLATNATPTNLLGLINGDDWRKLKSIAVRLWHRASDSVRRFKAIARSTKSELIDYYVVMAAYDKYQLTIAGSSLAHYGVWLQGLTVEEHRRINEEADKHYPM